LENLSGIRDSYGMAMLELGRRNPRVVALVPDAKFSSKMEIFEKEFPDRFFDIGVCEQNLMGVAAGMAAEGKIPFVSAIACFASMRAFEMARTAVAYQKLNVKIVAMSAGFAYPQLGATHTCVEDIAIMRAAANMAVVAPSDNMETYKATLALADYEGPVFMRLGRHPVPDIYDESHQFVLGKGSMLREGNHAAIIAIGHCVPIALDAHALLSKEGIQVRVINMSTVKPLDEQMIVAAAKDTGHIVTIEEHNLMGGLGGAVAELLSEKCPTRMKMVGIPNETPPVGPREYQLKRYGMTPEGIAESVKSLLGK